MDMNVYASMGMIFLVGSLLLITEVVCGYRHYSKIEPLMSYEEDVKYNRLLKGMLFRRIFIIGIAVTASEVALVALSITAAVYK